ncbi:hypothetical protein JOL62DRAFT_568326 [Phyllosticta paracitricarpa]|uniref:Secreted protein n=1 Tax=Phyllosticta paracitricarpa TaxID=2016321 RepID=A0ABR1NCF9_9PEZI
MPMRGTVVFLTATTTADFSVVAADDSLLCHSGHILTWSSSLFRGSLACFSHNSLFAASSHTTLYLLVRLRALFFLS